MKALTSVFLAFAVFSIAVFGFSMMGNHEGAHGGCIAAITQGVECSITGGILSYISLHLDAFYQFTSAVFGSGFAEILTLITLLALIFIYHFSHASLSKGAEFNVGDAQLEQNKYSVDKKLSHWLSLHENSPNLFVTARA